MMALDWNLIGPLAAAMTAGGLIGVERTYHGHPAGFRTHVMVCMTSCLLMLAAMHQSSWMFIGLPHQNLVVDPTRMSHGILTGIGFLCAGVIFREGFSIHGLTTAASVWTTSAIGMLFGVGMWTLALMATVATLSILAILRLLDARLPQLGVVDVVLKWAPGTQPNEGVIRALFADRGIKVTRIGHVFTEDRIHEHRIKARGPVPLQIGALSDALSVQQGLVAFSIIPRED